MKKETSDELKRNWCTQMFAKMTKAEFDALSKREQRVLIAHDVLVQLEMKKFQQKRLTYFSFKIKDKSLKKLVGEAGIAQISERSLKNKLLAPEDFVDGDETLTSLSAQKMIKESSACYVCAKGAVVCSFIQKFNERTVIGMDEDDEEIMDIFGYSMWEEMEDLFEGWNGKKKSIKWIMENIIENGGFLVVKGKTYGDR